MPRNFFQGAASGASIAGGATGFNPYATIAGGIVGGVASLFEKSDKEIKAEQVREYIKRRRQMQELALANLQKDTATNIGRINQFTTGSIKRGQGDISALRASQGKGFDEADMLSLQGKANEQGSNAIQSTQDMADKYRRQLEESYQSDIMNAEMEGITYPEEPNFTDVLGSLAPAALQYGMNQQYLKNMSTVNTGGAKTNPNGTPSIPNTGYYLSGEDNLYDMGDGSKYKLRKRVNVNESTSYPSWFGGN